MPETFSVAKDSIQIPYRRFLADSSPGFVLILLVAASYYYPIFTSHPLHCYLGDHPAIGQEMRVFSFVALFLLATPLGFMINALGWLLLSQAHSQIEHLCCQRWVREMFFPIWEIFEARHLSALLGKFNIDKKAFAIMTWSLSSSFENPHLAKLVPETHTRGLVIFLRGLALLLIAGGIVALCSAQRTPGARVLCIVSTIVVCVALTRRWSRIGRFNDILSLLVGLSGMACIMTLATTGINGSRFFSFGVADDILALKGTISIGIAIVLVFIAGVIGYYNRSAIVLHAHLASAAIGVLPDAASDGSGDSLLRTVTALVARAAALERKA